MANLVLHEDPRSGNCYKIRLTAALLDLPLLAQVNSNGRIPVLQIGDRFLPESNAACWYLAEGSELIPADRFQRADMLRWMFFEQYNHEPNVATLRFWLAFVGEANLSEQQRAQIPVRRTAGEDALASMDRHLGAISLYAYTHVAEAGGFRLRDYSNICSWLERVAALPGYVPMN
jgi:glutathione S-transferase